MKPQKISENVYEIPKSGCMNVPARIFASEKLIGIMSKDKTFQQVQNVACLPGILKASIAVADAHQGYGFSIGGVAAFDLKKGVISPGGVGYDINCGMRLLKTNLMKKDVEENKEKIMNLLFEKVPSGLGRGGKFQISYKELDKLLLGGAKYLVEKGYGAKEDYLHAEEEGCLKGADPRNVSLRAKKRGVGQVGTLGAGNHFLEVQFVDEVFDKEVAKTFGLKKNQVVVMIHCGSRGLGHQVASDYIQAMGKEYGFSKLPDSELTNAPISSKLGREYYSAMAAAANFAFANRQLIASKVREAFNEAFPKKKIKVDVVYDVCHNIAKFEEHKVGGKMQTVCVHRKGATRSFGKGRKEIPKDYRKVGQPVLIPGSMGTSSYVLVGNKKAEELTFGSTVHGAGRAESRSSAKSRLSGANIKKQLEKQNIGVKVENVSHLAEEAPEVYKDIDEVVKVVHDLGLSKKVVRLKPLFVVKG